MFECFAEICLISRLPSGVCVEMPAFWIRKMWLLKLIYPMPKDYFITVEISKDSAFCDTCI